MRPSHRGLFAIDQHHELVDPLKREKLVVDWRQKQQARAGVMQTLKLMRRLPEPFTKNIRTGKLARAHAHVYDIISGREEACTTQQELRDYLSSS